MSASPVTFSQVLTQAQKAYDESLDSLNTSVGSVAQQIAQVDTETKTMSKTLRVAENFKTLKESFTQFLEPQLSKYETAQKAKNGGLAAIKTIEEAFKVCKTDYPKPEEIVAIKNYMLRIGAEEKALTKQQEKAAKRIENYPFTAQIQKLTPLVEKITEQMTLLEASLNNAFYEQQKDLTEVGLVGTFVQSVADVVPTFTYSYFNAAMAAKKQAAAVAEPELKQIIITPSPSKPPVEKPTEEQTAAVAAKENSKTKRGLVKVA